MLSALRSLFFTPKPTQFRASPQLYASEMKLAQHQKDEEFWGLGLSGAAHDQKKVCAARAFIADTMKDLADKHATAVSQLDLMADDVDEAVKVFDQRLTLAQYLMLQQSDTRWSKSITDLALEDLDIYAPTFRSDAKEATQKAYKRRA